MASIMDNSLSKVNSSEGWPQQQHIYDLPIGVKRSEILEGSLLTGGTNLEENRPYCRALYDFRSEFPNELGFSAGDIIFIEKRRNSEWIEGECQSNGRRGIFPQSFVDIVVPLSDEETVAEHLSVPFSSDQIGVASALFDFQSRFPDELPLRAGESVQILELVGSEWVKCRHPTNGMVGIAPQSFLNIFFDAAVEVTNKFVNSSAPSQTDFFGEIVQQSNKKSLDETRPWDEPLFKFPAFSSNSQQTPAPFFALTDSDSLHWIGSANDAFSHRPPPRPPPPKLSDILLPKNNSRIVTKAESPKVFSQSTSSSSLLHQTEVESSKQPSLQKRLHHQQSGVELGCKADENKAGHEVRGVSLNLPNSPHLPMHNATMANAAPTLDAKQKVVLDLLNTERTYLLDLNAWETSIHESAELSTEDKKALTNGYLPLKQLSQALISSIEAQKDLSAADQRFGDAFMELQDNFFAAYAYHFRYVEQTSVIVENEEDEALQKALQKCLLAMRQKGSNVFDVPSAVSRPIQRCLKYPLYVGELLKNTPIHHPDHPKLMQSLRQFGTLASRMNECKRRKELIRKYRTQEQLSLAERLSRINMHSLVKKSNRLKYRINRSIGLNTTRYTEFDYLVQLLEEAERRLCKFLYCAQLYKKHIEQSLKRHEDSYKGVCHAQDENAVKAFAGMFRRLDELCRRYLQTFEQEVVTEGKKLVRSDIAKLVHKRFDKLADYETARAAHKNSDNDEVEMRRAEFEALNNQIKAHLPRVIGTINARVLELIQRVNEFDAKFLCRMDEWFVNERPAKVRDCFSAALPFRAHLFPSHRHTLAELNKIAAHLSAGTNPLNRRKSLRLSLRGTKANSQRHNESGAQQKAQERRPQTVKERDALTKICHAQKQTQQLRRVQCDWESASMVLKQGDTVVVKAHRQDGLSLCDNAVSTGFIPITLLEPFDNNFVAPLSPINENVSDANKSAVETMDRTQQNESFLLDFTTSSDVSNSQRFGQTNPSSNQQLDKTEKEVNLIDLEDNLIDLDSPPKTDVQPRELKPVSSFLADQSDNGQFLTRSYVQEDLLEIRRSPTPMPPIPDRPMASSLHRPTLPSPILSSQSASLTSSFSGIQPIRAAPPPPSANWRHDVTHQHHLHSCEQSQPDDGTSHFSQPSFAVCMFNFAPAHGRKELGGNQLTIMEGEMVEVIRRHDDAGNTEWWLVNKAGQLPNGTDQQQGYVPSNYLSSLKSLPMNTRV